jgi:hypothetical protein
MIARTTTTHAATRGVKPAVVRRRDGGVKVRAVW